MAYKEFNELSTKLAYCLVYEGIVTNQIVPLCFKKSREAMVSMLSVLKAGGGFFLGLIPVYLSKELPPLSSKSVHANFFLLVHTWPSPQD